jgi:hypothetical protein
MTGYTLTKRDRIAVVISAVYFAAVPGLHFMHDGEWRPVLILATPIFVYWGYRFIKGDISFIGSRFKDSI